MAFSRCVRKALMKAHHFIAAALAALACSAGAQTLKPGLWEVTNQMQTGSGHAGPDMSQMQQQMAGMPPEQRRMMEEMMAKQGVRPAPAGPNARGAAGGHGRGAGGMSVKVCLTPEMVQKNELPAQQGDCQTTQQSRSGNTMKMAFACTNPPSTGEGQVIFKSPEAYSMKMVVSSQVQGKAEKMHMDGAGKWLGPDCGNVKPIVAPKKVPRP